MIILRQKYYSFKDRLKAGFKSGKTGATLGGLLIPGNLLLALCGKTKAALILTGVGAGIGAGIGFYHGYSGQKYLDDYNKRLLEDPEFKKSEEKRKLSELKENIQTIRGDAKNPIPTKQDFKNNKSINYPKDVYHYIDVYTVFRKKYLEEWIKAWDVLKSWDEIDMEFDIVFPKPFVDEDSNGETDYIVANGNSASDHYWILWDNEKGYNNDLGSGRAKGKTLLEACQNFAAQWIVDENKIKFPHILEVAKIHNKIIKEFLKLK